MTYISKVSIPLFDPNPFSLSFFQSFKDLVENNQQIQYNEKYDNIDINPSNLVSKHRVTNPLRKQWDEVGTYQYNEFIHILFEIKQLGHKRFVIQVEPK